MVRQLLIAGLLLAAPAAASAQTSIYPPAMAKGEVLLQISADGMDKTVADSTLISGKITGKGKDAKSARIDAEKQMAALQAKLGQLGVPADKISKKSMGGFFDMFQKGSSPVGFGEGEEQSFTDEMPVSVELSDVGLASRVQSAMEDAGIAVEEPKLMLASDAAAHGRAVAAALASARSKADAHAAPLGMQVLRIARISNEASGGLASMYGPEYRQMTTQLMSNFGMGAVVEGDRVVTSATVYVDFVLGPK
jgi:uncharacterized protein YggE